MKKIFIQCSNCGEHRTVKSSGVTADLMYLMNYRVVGDALYCPKCVKSWKERNGKKFNEMYKDPVSMFFRWARSKGFNFEKEEEE